MPECRTKADGPWVCREYVAFLARAGQQRPGRTAPTSENAGTPGRLLFKETGEALFRRLPTPAAGGLSTTDSAALRARLIAPDPVNAVSPTIPVRVRLVAFFPKETNPCAIKRRIPWATDRSCPDPGEGLSEVTAVKDRNRYGYRCRGIVR